MDSPRAGTVPSDTLALIALLRHGRRPRRDYADLIEEAASTEAVLSDEQRLLAPQLVEEARREVENWLEAGIRPVGLLEPDYPPNLRAVYDRPPLLFIGGHISPCDARSVAVIGSRKASQPGLERAREIAVRLTAADYTVVSGLAAGVDAAAHRAALDNGGRTIAVIGTGLRHSYPPENRALQTQIAREGAVVSQFWPDEGPSRQSFPLRNAVMSGLSLATLIVEAGARSGARIQARLALGHGRPVLLAEPVLDQTWAAELASKPGVYAFASAGQAIEVIERQSSTGPLAA